jgi:hypothetical protein
LVFENPLKALALIKRGELAAKTWFSHGHASVIVFDASANELEGLLNADEVGFRALERWEIHEHRVTETEPRLCEPNDDCNLAPFEYPALDSDTRVLLDEFSICLHTGVRAAAQYSPQSIAVFTSLERAVREIAEELNYLADPSGNRPVSLPDLSASALSDVIEIQRRTHQRVGQLVQINSALSYVISQAFSGTFPLRESVCQVRRHSFLGIGAAVNALSAFARFVERVFQANPVDEAIDSRYGVPATGIEVFPLLKGGFNPDVWRLEKFHVDTFLKTVEATAVQPKLVFYSGRLGFREAEFAVTAALQVLAAADSTRWSLMTLSHELMHAHVRAIIATLFNETGQGAEENFRAYYDELSNVAQGRVASQSLSLKATLRLAILNYCTIVPWLQGIATGEQSEQAIKLIKPEVLRTILARESRAINHIFVHVFDYYYFYNGRAPLYLKLLWESWSTVPAVLENVEEYALRSIVTISTSLQGNTHERFKLALSALREELKTIAAKDEANGVVRRALQYLDVVDNIKRLEVYFAPKAYLAEIAAKLLVASSVHAQLMEDENAEQDDDGTRYVLESGEFLGVDVQSPVAFVVDRLRRALLTVVDEEDEEWRSAWLLIVCASALQ